MANAMAVRLPFVYIQQSVHCINYETFWVVFIIIQEVQQLFCTNVPRNHRYTKTIVLYSLRWYRYAPPLQLCPVQPIPLSCQHN